jgi:hypothetical protein
MPDPSLPPPTPAPPKQKRGCLFYGCISLAVLLILGGIGAWVTFRYAVKTASVWIDQYTSTNPVPIESVTISRGELKSLQDRLTSFSEALAGRAGERELILTAEDINALIQNDPQYKDMKGKLFVIIEGDQIKGKLSMPLDDFGPFKMKGRYLNGVATLKASLENGVLDVKIKDVRVGDNSLPAPILAQIKNANFAQEFQKDPNAQRTIEKLESIKVKDGKIIIRAKQAEKP